jgi:hypothetical protein
MTWKRWIAVFVGGYIFLLAIFAILQSLEGDPVEVEIPVTWTAPGDDGHTGTASHYSLRYSDEIITQANWGSANIVDSSLLMMPLIAGSPETLMVVLLLESEARVYFAIKTADENDNWSSLSNLAVYNAEDYIPPGAITDLNVE